MKAVLFDFGGTLDADGIAWKERFHACYRDAGLDLDAAGFARRFYDADDPLVGTLPETAGLDETVGRLVGNIEAGLQGVDGRNIDRGRQVAARFLAESRATLARNAGVLARLAEHYELGIVSNFYGNLSAVCRDAGISRYMTVMVDSAKVGAEKPSPEIFRAALAGLAARAEDCIFVGDSLRRDRTGARNMGMPFVWVAPPDAARPADGRTGRSGRRQRRGARRDADVSATSRAALRGGIIAAGEGSRLRAAGVAVPKPLVTVAGRPLLQHVLDNFRAAAIARIAIILNENSPACAAWLDANARDRDIDLVVKTTASSFESFRIVAQRLAGARAVISTVDAWIPNNGFAGFVAAAAALPEDAWGLGVTTRVDDEKPLWVDLDPASGRVTAIGGASGTAVTAGLYALPASAAFPANADFARLRDYLGWVVASGRPVIGIPVPDVVDVDRTSDIAAAESIAASTQAASARGASVMSDA